MKIKWCALLISFISIVLICMIGCTNKQYTKDEVYEEFQKQIDKMSYYTCTANVEAIGNKERSKYVMKHIYKKPDYYKLEIKSPENLKGKTIEYKGDKVIVYNPTNKDTVELPNVNNDEHYLFVGDFIKNYMENENINLSISENDLKIEVEIPGNNPYFNKQILYVNNKTKNPEKMEILNNEENAIFIVTYEDFQYKK